MLQTAPVVCRKYRLVQWVCTGLARLSNGIWGWKIIVFGGERRIVEEVIVAYSDIFRRLSWIALINPRRYSDRDMNRVPSDALQLSYFYSAVRFRGKVNLSQSLILTVDS
jgi:hypothetical protein